MPFKSQAQRRFMYSQHPKIAKEWQSKTTQGKKLPEKVSSYGNIDDLESGDPTKLMPHLKRIHKLGSVLVEAFLDEFNKIRKH